MSSTHALLSYKVRYFSQSERALSIIIMADIVTSYMMSKFGIRKKI